MFRRHLAKLGMRPFDVQLAAGVAMFKGALVELATGEGKTLTATFPAFLHALTGKGVHVATVNDYLAKRDAELLSPVYNLLGLTVGVLQMQMEDGPRGDAYRRDITYGTASEFGFDFLRDRLKLVGGQVAQAPFWAAWQAGEATLRSDKRVQRGHCCALVDEVDSIFIDEARTPLIISAPDPHCLERGIGRLLLGRPCCQAIAAGARLPASMSRRTRSN